MDIDMDEEEEEEEYPLIEELFSRIEDLELKVRFFGMQGSMLSFLTRFSCTRRKCVLP